MASKPTYEELEKRILELEQSESEKKKTNQWYSSLLQKAQAAIVVHRADTSIEMSNATAQRLLGLTEEQMLGKTAMNSAWSFLREDGSIMPTEEYPVNRVVANKKSLRNFAAGIYLSSTKDIVWVLVNAEPVFDEEGRLSSVIVTFMDTTARKRVEEELRLSSEKYLKVFKAVPTLMALSRLEDGVYTEVNDEFVERTGFSREDAIGKTAIELGIAVSKSYRNKIKSDFEKDGRFRGVEVAIQLKDGEIHDGLLSGEIFDIDGQRYLLSAWTDITERKRAEEILRKKELELENKSLKLEEANTALKVLLDHKEREKTEVEEKIISNVTKLIIPFVERLKASRLDIQQNSCLGIIEANLRDIISPFAHRLSSNFTDLTPTEIQVADLIKRGRINKEIAELLCVSKDTVKFHRANIRKKFGLKNTQKNLKSHLLTLTKG